MKNKYCVLLVNYNIEIKETYTFNSLKKIQLENLKIIVWDNLPKDENKDEVRKMKNAIYIPSYTNETLSRIYNNIISNFIENDDFLVLLDNDTELDVVFFEKIEKASSENKEINLFVPIIKINNKVYSPAKNLNLFLFKVKEGVSKKISSKNIFAVNSGMVIRTIFFKLYEFKYDEDLKFYGTDNFFMKIYSKTNKYMYILDYEIKHNLSHFMDEEILVKLWRFNDLINGIEVLSRYEKWYKKIYCKVFIFLMRLKKMVQFKDFRFLLGEKNEKDKIIFLIPQFKTGGGNRVFIELANKLVEQGNVVEILYPNNSEEKNTFYVNSKIDTKAIGNFSKNKTIKLINVIYFLFWVRKNKRKDKIVFTDPIMSIFIWILYGRNIYRFIQADDYSIFDDLMILKNNLLLYIYKSLLKISYKYKFVKYIFNSRYVYECYLKDSNRYDVPFLLVHPSINKEIFNVLDKGDNNKNLNICLVARKHPWKGFKDFLDCFEKLDENYLNKIRNVFIISHDDLTEFDLSNEKFKRIIPKNDKEIAKTYRNSDIFISTSWWEGFGLPPLEAMACGCSILTSKSGGVNEYVKENFNCLMYTPKDVLELKIKLMDLIDDSEKREKLIENSKKVLKEFSWDISVEQFKKILEVE